MTARQSLFPGISAHGRSRRTELSRAATRPPPHRVRPRSAACTCCQSRDKLSPDRSRSAPVDPNRAERLRHHGVFSV